MVALLTAAVAGVHVARKNEAWLRRSGSRLHGAARRMLSSSDPSDDAEDLTESSEAPAAPQAAGAGGSSES